MSVHRGLLIVVGAALLGACGVPIRSGAHFTQSWAPERQVTFAWRDARDRVIGDSRLEGNRFFHGVLHEAVEWELSLRGIRYDDEAPALLIHHHLSLADHVLETEVIDDSGDPVTEIYEYEGASLVLHIVEAGSGDDVWVSWAEANVEPAFRSPEAMRDWVYDLVGVMFDDWPLSARTQE